MNLRSAANAAVLLAALAACKPSAHGRCVTQADCRAGAYCSSDGICLPEPSTPPSVIVSVPAAPDAVNGWVPRTAGDLEVRALVDDGGGIGPTAATLSIDTCPGSGLPCSYTGVILARSGSAATFSFQVPRAVQAAGSEAPIPVTVTATNTTGTQGTGPGMLQIDDAPPVIGAIRTVVAGTVGENGQTWYLGGPSAPDIEIVVPVSDSGSGFSSLTIQINAADVTAGTNLSPTAMPKPDGTVRFLLQASHAKPPHQGPVGFTLTAADALGHQSTAQRSINVDDTPPTVSQPHVDYANATPSLPSVCSGDPQVTCGRQGGNLLADDTATVTFDITDCGSGIAAGSQPKATVAGAAGGFSITQTSASASSCANGNRVHHFQFTLDLSKVALPSAPATGNVIVAITGNAIDLVTNAGTSPANSGTSGDGLVLVSLWRWKRALASSVQAAPALLPGTAGMRQVVLGTNASGDATHPNILVVGPDGSSAKAVSVSQAVQVEVAVAPSGNIYVVNGTNNGQLTIVTPSVVLVCANQSNDTFGAPAIISTVSNHDVGLVVATARSNPAANNFFTFDGSGGSCAFTTPTTPLTLPTGVSDFTGATVSAGFLFGSHAQGFTSYDLSNTSSSASYSASTLPSVAAPPALNGSSGKPIFGTADNTHQMHRTVNSTTKCPVLISSCWIDDGTTFTGSVAPLPFTPVYDGTAVWNVDNAGKVYRWLLSDGSQKVGYALGAAASAPVLLQDGSALLVQTDGGVTVVSPAGTPLSLGNVGPIANPLVPVLDTRTSGEGVAYVPNAGVLWAVQTPAPPLAASNSLWPRPGHDSCNSRNSGTSASACP